jgi:uncharacterized protein with PIN domain
VQKNDLQRKFAVAVLLFLAATSFLGCATTSEPVLTSEQMAARGIDEAAMRRGRALAMTECTECHRYYWPHEYSVEQWRGIVKKMGKRASLSKSQIEDLELYFVTTREAMQPE